MISGVSRLVSASAGARLRRPRSSVFGFGVPHLPRRCQCPMAAARLHEDLTWLAMLAICLSWFGLLLVVRLQRPLLMVACAAAVVPLPIYAASYDAAKARPIPDAALRGR